MTTLDEAKKISNYFLKKTYKRYTYPYVSNTSEDYNLTFSKRSKEYINTIKHFPENKLSEYIKTKKSSIEELSNGLIEVVEIYLKGNAFKAYSIFNKLMEERSHILFDLSSKYSKNEKFYRIRTSNCQIENKEEIFHIPFNLRHLVSTQRYSIAGVPSLYLGKTIYSCWIELDKPSLNKMYISKFEIENDINVIDFTLNLELLDTILPVSSDRKIKAFFELFPLILACGFKKKYSNVSFNEEYIIPNMLLQWISEEKSQFDGLIYLSTKMTHLDFNSIGSNIVLPTKKISIDNQYKFCEKLIDTFRLTPPISWEILNSLSSLQITSWCNIEKVENSFIEILENKYELTEFKTNEDKIDGYFNSSKIINNK